MSEEPCANGSLLATGVAGLDDVLCGGLPAHRVYLVEGNPGSGKTTLALQYLLEGKSQGESGLYVTLSETRTELEGIAASHGWSLDGIDLVELVAPEDQLEPNNQYTMFMPAEIELNVTTKSILNEVDRVKPSRIVIDSLSEMRLLSQNSLRYRRQILALKQYFIGRACTVLLLDDKTSDPADLQLQSIAHGVITLEHLAPEYGGDRRRLRVVKMRGRTFRGGYHDFNIATGGLDVFPRIIAAEHIQGRHDGLLQNEIAEFNTLLGGGIDYGTNVLLIGPAGSGKSSVAVSYAYATASRGDRAALFIFEERAEVLLKRSAGLGMDLQPFLDSGQLTLRQIDPAELSPGEFSHEIRVAAEGTAERPGARVVVIDSLNGYLQAMPNERFLTAQLHELLSYLGHKGVVTFLVLAQHGLIGHMESSVDTTYLADTVILFRYFEAAGAIRQALSVMKKRCGRHERTIREIQFADGIHVGAVLYDFHGVLTGTPVYQGTSEPLLKQNHD